MAKLKVQGNASGTGVVTLTAPNTNTDRTITLPDGDISLGVGIDDNATSTAITIDASENVLIGMTAVSGTTDGLHLRSGIASGVNVTNDHCFALNRKSSDGEALRFLKDGALVGSIDVSASGASIKLGGTAAANALDDYEEGTWTPTWSGATSSDATYTKIGRVVYASGKFAGTGSGTSGDCGGLPYASAIDGSDGGGSGYHGQDADTWSVLKNTSTNFRFYMGSGQKQISASNPVRFFLTYHI